MKPLISSFLGLAVFLTAAVSFSQEKSVASITGKFEKEKAAALEKYLKDNPDAEDFGAGQEALLISYLMLGNMEKLPDLIESAYESIDKSDPGMIMQRMVMPMVQAAAQTGDKNRARKFIEKVKGEYISHPAAGQIMGILQQSADMLDRPGIGEEMEIAFEDFNSGKEIDLAEMKGKVVLVDYWATWCQPCMQTMPEIVKAYEKFNDEGFEVIGISLDENRGDLERYLDRSELPWPQAFDGKGFEGDLARKFKINGIPALFLIGKDGKVAAANLFGAELERRIREELAKEFEGDSEEKDEKGK